MTPEESLNLKRLISQSDEYQDNTDYIRRVKHSEKIRDDIRKLDLFMKNNKNLKKKNPTGYQTRAMNECSFLFTNYTDIFNKILAEEIDFAIMTRLLTVLKLIEDNRVDQNEGSVMVGKILKELYIDSAMKRGENLDKQYGTNEEESKKIEGKSISWSEWKRMNP
jgi:hypothetical protein